MTDIVERLRAGALGADIEGADEIERLQELLRSVGTNRYWEGRWRHEKAENERLNGLLAEQAKHIAGFEEWERVWADEIEQLRADLDLRNQTAVDRKEIIARLEAEIAELKALVREGREWLTSCGVSRLLGGTGS